MAKQSLFLSQTLDSAENENCHGVWKYVSSDSLYLVFIFQQVVLTTLLVACSTSFVLNAYNFLFLKRFAIYVWFAIAPLIWVVCPLTGAAWVTKTYLKYKMVVVNAWVDIPEVSHFLLRFLDFFFE